MEAKKTTITNHTDGTNRFKTPSIRIINPLTQNRTDDSSLLSVKFNTINNSTSIANSTIPLRNRNKVKLKPGHSPLDWNHIVTTEGINGELITGLSQLKEDSTFLQLNSKTSIHQLNLRIPPYKIKPHLKINKEILQKHQKWISTDDKTSTDNDYWCVIDGNVYCLTKYLEFHPGGIDIITSLKDKDLLPWFNKHHRWVSYEKLLQTCFVGIYVEEKYV